MRTQLKYVIIPTTAVTVSLIREGYHYNLKHNLFARKHPFSAPIQPLKTSQYSPHPILSRCMTARGDSYTLIIIIYLITYISARRGAGTCTDATMRARDTRAAGRPAAARARRAEGQSGANTAKNREAVWVFQILCLPLPDAEVAPAPANAISNSVEVPTAAVRQLCRRLGLCTMVAGTMRQVTGTMHQVTGTMHQVAGSKNKGQKIYII